MRYSLPLSLAGLAALILCVLAGSGAARAQQTLRPLEPSNARALRSVVDHYRTLTWTFERATNARRTPTSYSYRRSRDRSYLQWTIDRWTTRAYTARGRALLRVRRRLHLALPRSPRLHGRLAARIGYERKVTLKLRRIYPGTVTRRYARAEARTAAATLRLWQKRLAAETVQVIRHGYAREQVPTFLESAFTCIHHYEGAWNANTGNGYYGGLQMDIGFQSTYGGDFLRRWGTADGWPAWAQIAAAARAYRSGRGFGPWPNTARACGLL
jgi:hypothetical protein